MNKADIIKEYYQRCGYETIGPNARVPVTAVATFSSFGGVLRETADDRLTAPLSPRPGRAARRCVPRPSRRSHTAETAIGIYTSVRLRKLLPMDSLLPRSS